MRSRANGQAIAAAPPSSSSASASSFWLVAGLLLVAANLRAPITGVAPVLETIRAAFGLSPAQAGLLTTLPLLAFGLLSPFAALLARRVGLERSLFGALLFVGAGIALRSGGSAACLYLGTAVIGAGIAVGNVLMPGLVKRDFPARVPAVTGLCAIAMGGVAALASGSAVPLANALGWRAALGAGIVFPLLALAFWGMRLRRAPPGAGTAAAPQRGGVWRSALAWQVTLFMGTNSLLYYVLVGWLPSMLAAAGFAPGHAGSVHGVMQLATALPGLVLGPVVGRLKDQRLLAAGMGLLMAAALLGLLLAPGWAWLWAFALGIGSGGGVLLALMFMGLRSGSAHQAAALSGMAQCVGYLLAASGPALAGMLRESSGGWDAPLGVGVALAGAMTVFGALAGRARTVGAPH